MVTVALDEDLFAAAAAAAAARGLSVEALVAFELRRALRRTRPARPVVVGGGLLPGVDLEDRSMIDIWAGG